MVHVTEENLSIVDTDLLIRECINASGGENAFAYIVSPFISDYKVPSGAISFASNIVSISDVDFFTDLVRLLARELQGAQNTTSVYIVCNSPNELANQGMRSSFVREQKRVLLKFQEMDCDVRINNDLHAKATVTSSGALFGSFNLTTSGRFYNEELGSLIVKNGDEKNDEYLQKQEWAKEKFDNGKPLTEQHLDI